MKRLLSALLLTTLTAAASAQTAPAVSAGAVAQALARGATVVDLRARADYLAGHLPGAVSLDPGEVGTDLHSLQAAVSRHGIDLSREVVLMGLPGDLRVQQLQLRLMDYATGRVDWLVGGAHEWALSGRPLEDGSVSLPAVPQYLVALNRQDESPRMAGASLRDAPGRAFVAKVALGPRS
ncbi:MAG: hypothetical protein KIS62_18270 [Ramlibacter sp.]|nr:hypothetical protein [Ramlibacter sp.]